MDTKDRTVVRDLAQQYVEICGKEIQNERRDLWRRHNSFVRTPPLIYVRAFAWGEMPESHCTCEDPFYRHYESFFRQRLFWDTFEDDSIFEPWVTVNAACVTPNEGIWGLPIRWISGDDPRGAKQMDPPIKAPEDAQRMVVPHHVIDEEETARRAARVQDVLGDIITVVVDRAPVYRVWNGDISTLLARLRGLDQIMYDMMDRPEWLHDLLAFMRDGILQTHDEAEKAGDWALCDHQNQAMSYAVELPDPTADGAGVPREKLWYYCASQETTLIGPQQFDEFMFQYQLPIMEKFGLVAYGCCEDLTQKIDVLRQLPNLRRIGVAPVADVAKCAEQIGEDYIFSYRPSPADMVGYGFDPDRMRRILRADLEACRANGCHVDVTLKDVETVQGDPERVRTWVKIVREESERLEAGGQGL